jgi:hypothetical protein
MRPEEIIEQTIATIRATKNIEMRMAANEYPDQTVTLEDVADAVDQALQEVSQALTDALGNSEKDEQSERDRWWYGYPEEHPYDTCWDNTTEDHPLPRDSSALSWWSQ